ncbi:hypothetical protein ASPACDRAFT_52471 [Aspergillus aculeatus ATCC 16872]|uniref:Nephrocystin 3-like N-terminal domain-containing protein n=1 Tax=Aspergillus aculeatus (strain ATCC 16872 / CBS 172.66 / WB 5094) TaxID=690307 RepID=A0A1L9WUT1_ASPA1|nr:uncharacterized protein ASPACDRAFT_52471 [Aspergillus aculeatus ATCC 16872]OJJ99921.1 hypothetical protein ASPACDRAFT_52471 [Aspergillus aculeatus ATCC 16872]
MQRYAVYEEIYRGCGTRSQQAVEDVFVKVYLAVLHYTHEVIAIRRSKSKRIRDSMQAAATFPLTVLKSAIADMEAVLQSLGTQRAQEMLTAVLDSVEAAFRIGIVKHVQPVKNAMFDSSINQMLGECIEDTRDELLDQIEDWMDNHKETPIFWLDGMAGIGKSAIARTVAIRLSERKLLGASFFFSRGDVARRDPNNLFITLAMQLAERLPPYKKLLYDWIANNLSITSPGIGDQFRFFFSELLPKIKSPSRHKLDFIMVIDALDECENEGNSISIIIDRLPQIQRANLDVSLRFFVTGRPEIKILKGLNLIHDSEHKDVKLIEIAQEITKRDISKFYTHWPSNDWPSEATIQKLTDMAYPLFIVASTVCKFMDTVWEPLDSRLQKMQSTYDQLLLSLLPPDPDDQKMEEEQIATHLENFQSSHQGLRRDICSLGDFGEQANQAHRVPVSEFISPELEYSCRYWIYHIKEGEGLASRTQEVLLYLRNHFLHWLEAMSVLGRMGECVEPAKSHLADLVNDAVRFIDNYHYVASISPLQIYTSALAFAPHSSVVRQSFASHLPNWLTGIPRVQGSWGSELHTLEYKGVCASQAVFSQDGSILASFNNDNTIRLWKTSTGQLIQTIPDITSGAMMIMALLFSGDGTRCFSSAENGSIIFWDAKTGEPVEKVSGHTEKVHILELSPDGRLLASGSYDHMVKLWEVPSGKYYGSLIFHQGPVTSISFSPDNRLLVSGSMDCMIGLWDVATCTVLRTIRHMVALGHSSGDVSFIEFAQEMGGTGTC